MASKAIKNLLIIVAITAVLDISVAQILNYVWAPSFWAAKEGDIRTRSNIYNHDLLPMRKMSTSWGPIQYPSITNSLGFRDSEKRDIPLTPDGARLLIIGDSFTEGLGVPFEETFAGRIQIALRPKKIDVLNAGVASYSPSIYYAKIRYLVEEVGLRFSHLAVFLDISDIEDEANTFSLNAEDRVACKASALKSLNGRRWCQDAPFDFVFWAKRTINNNSVTGRILFLIYRSYRAQKSEAAEVDCTDPVDCMTGRRRGLWTHDEAIFEAYGKRGLEQSSKVLTRLRNLCRKHGIEMILSVYPWPDQILRQDNNAIQVRHWRDWSSAHNVKFLNLFPDFINQEPPRAVILQNFIPGDVHWSAEGHARIANGFLREIVMP